MVYLFVNRVILVSHSVFLSVGYSVSPSVLPFTCDQAVFFWKSIGLQSEGIQMKCLSFKSHCMISLRVSHVNTVAFYH